MNILLKIILYQFGFLLFFSILYFNYKDHFIRDNSVVGHHKITFIDCLLLSTTIQSAIGYTDLFPVTHLSKILLTIQQMVVICTYSLFLYLFTV